MSIFSPAKPGLKLPAPVGDIEPPPPGGPSSAGNFRPFVISVRGFERTDERREASVRGKLA